MMKNHGMLFLVLSSLALLCFFPGCAEEDGGGTVPEPPASTAPVKVDSEPATTQAVTTQAADAPVESAAEEPASPPAALSLGRSCSADDECTSSCCAFEDGRGRCRNESVCMLAKLGEDDCYEKGFYWCIDRCVDKKCGDCKRHVRCVDVDGVPKVETAVPVEGRKGACKYSGTYEDAGGNESYCDRNEGRMIYGKCGMEPSSPEDCSDIYGEYGCYPIPHRRSFHSPEGEEYDLWCFSCSKVVEQ